jgi:Protein of unknown function (DUF2752)
MPASSFGISVAPKPPDRVLTGPMTLALLTLLACAITRVSGLDHAGVSFCYFKALTGHACFTCGATRAIGHLARFDLPSAFAIQPLVTASALGLLLWGAVDVALLPASRRTVVRVEGRTLRLITVFGVALATLNWIYLLSAGV